LSDMGDAALLWASDEVEALRVLDALQAMQTARFTSLGIRHVFSDTAYMRFYRELVGGGLADGSTVLTALVVNDEIIAAFLAVADGRRCTLIRSSQLTGEKWGPLGLGKLLIEKSMQALHARGCRVFDLSIGDHPYKYDFNAVSTPLFELELARTWRGVPALCRERTLALVRKSRWAASFARTIKRGLPLFPS